VAALVASSATVVLVTSGVGLGVVPEHRSGRLFRDLLGVVNQAVAAVCDEVHLVVAGRVLRL
jgi:adenosylcobinamide kinase/adenosylcobinamide-phosphate guanylyltransferase